MPLSAEDSFPFTALLVAGAPEQPGVYALWNDGDVIYIGHARGRSATIRSMLLDHLSGVHGPCTRRASRYSWEISLQPAQREAELLQEYLGQNRRLPRCNAAA